MIQYLKSNQYYLDLYDKHTVDLCRRLHDMNFRGWWSLILPLIFCIKTAILLTCGWGGCDDMWLIVHSSLPWLGGMLLLALVFMPGTNIQNRFEEDLL